MSGARRAEHENEQDLSHYIGDRQLRDHATALIILRWVKKHWIAPTQAVSFGYGFADTNRAIPNAAAAANPPITIVRNALGTNDIPV